MRSLVVNFTSWQRRRECDRLPIPIQAGLEADTVMIARLDKIRTLATDLHPEHLGAVSVTIEK